jgi:hypothetical protein
LPKKADRYTPDRSSRPFFKKILLFAPAQRHGLKQQLSSAPTITGEPDFASMPGQTEGDEGAMPQEIMIVGLSAIGAVTNVGDSMAIALAIAIHNIPEGICTSAPHYYPYGNRLKSFIVSSLSALPIVAGYIVARYLFVQITPQTMSVMVGATAGLMIYVSADELMPAAQNNSGWRTVLFFMLGIISVMLLKFVG